MPHRFVEKEYIATNARINILKYIRAFVALLYS